MPARPEAQPPPPGAAPEPAPGLAPGSVRYFAWLYAPAGQRELLAALCGIEHEIGSSVRPGLEHTVAHIRLEWWRSECERLVAGRPVHPLSRQLGAACGALPAQRLETHGLVDAAVWDLANATFESAAQVAGYCERWARAMTQCLAACALGERDPEQAAALGRAIGAPLREIELLAGLAHDAHAGRLRVPLDALARIGVAPEHLAHPPWPAALAEWLRERHTALRAALAAAIAQVPAAAQPRLRALLVWAELARRVSWRAERALPAALEPARLEAAASAWRGWRAARRAMAGRYR